MRQCDSYSEDACGDWHSIVYSVLLILQARELSPEALLKNCVSVRVPRMSARPSADRIAFHSRASKSVTVMPVTCSAGILEQVAAQRSFTGLADTFKHHG